MRDWEAKVERRNRPPKSCDPCRTRKLKCNRALPCDTCVKRGKTCQYAANADRSPRDTTGGAHRDTVTDRLRHLESLVVSLARQGSQPDPMPFMSASPTTHSQTGPPQLQMLMAHGDDSARVTAMTAESGISTKTLVHRHTVPPSRDDNMAAGGQRRLYVDPSHWTHLLEEIRQIRNELSPSTTQSPQENDVPDFAESSKKPSTEPSSGNGQQAGEDLVFAAFRALELPQILGSLPPRQVCDRLVSQYFRARHAILPVLHPAKFQREYASFWETPETTSPLWVGLLFAILSLAAGMAELSSISSGSDSTIPPAKLLSKCTEQCLVLGSYATAKELSIETLLVHLQSCYLRSKDSDLNLWFLMGVIIRLALKLGYHRDPSNLPAANLSPFDGEMRRRVWVTIFQIDTLMSFQMGLPSMIPAEYCDTALPRNLENSDFAPETPVLPPSRPVSDCTPVLYTIAKSSLMSVFRAVISHTRSLVPAPYETTMALDARLRSTYSDDVPSALRYRPIAQSIVDSPGIIMDRATIEMLYLKSVVVLHRQYITAQRGSPLFDFSRVACLQAAETVLNRQMELHEATLPGCQLFDQRWMVSALTMGDFILAAMVVCLEVTVRTRRLRANAARELGRVVRGGEEDAEVARYLGMLRRCQGVWAAAADFSTEARMAADAIGSTIRRTETWMEEGRCHVVVHSVSDTTSLDGGTVVQAYDEAALIDWGILDNQFHEPWEEGMDFDSWILDAVESSGPMDLL